jgi:PAS domain S-box-containing protein
MATVAVLNRLARWCAISVLLIGLLILASWALQIEAIKSVLTDRATMKPNTALAFVLAGIALGLRQRSALRLGCALAVMLLGGLSLAQDISGANFGTDELLFRDLAGAPAPGHPGRMSPITATCFMLLGGALALLGSRRAVLRRALEALALLALTLAMLGMIGYAYSTEALYALPGFGSMALHTALAFALLGIGTLSARPDGLAGVFASAGLGGQLARRILPFVFLTPLLVGWLILQGEQAGLFNSRQKTSVFAATMVLVLLAFSWRSALQLQSSDAKRLLAEALQRSVVEAAPNGLMLVDARGIITFVNGTMERLFGYTGQEMLGQTVEMFIPQHLRKPHLQQRDAFIADPHTRPMGAGRDLFGQRKDGSEFALEIGLRALQTPEGPLVLASIIDISARQQAEQKLREREALLETLTTHAKVGMVMVTAEHRYVFANVAYAHLLGLPSADIVGQRVADVLAPVYGSQIRPRLERAFGGERVTYELTQPPRAPGEGERFLAVSYDPPVETRHGLCVIVSVVDITERKRAENELHASNERTQMATQATGVGIWEWNVLDDTIRWDAQMFHIYGLVPTPDGLVPYSAWRDCVLPEDLPGQEAQLQGTIGSGGSGKREFRIRRASDAAWRHIEAGETVRNNADGKPEWVVGTNLDITERSRLEQETQVHAQTLMTLDRRKDEFLAMLGHELRNPLAAISNAGQLLRYQQNETPMQRHARQVIERQVGQLTHLVDDLLEVSRVTSGNVRLRKEPTSIAGVVQRAVETVQPLIAQHRHALALSLPPQLLFLQADAARLEQVLVNLLTNAAKYTEDGGRIGLSVQSEDDKVVIKVRDNGMGMAPELLPHIFELFTQAERSLDRSQGGLGIGLSLVQQLVELHGGTVAADSVLGQGSEFVVRLPAMPPEQAPAQASASQTSERLGEESTICQVLVVEDNVDAAQSLAQLLEISGHQVRLAYDGPSAVQAATHYRPDVVLLDIGLPKLDGYEVAAWMRQQAALKGVVLVALTGYGQDADHQRSQDAGFDHHLTKPVNFDKIKEILASVAPVVT